MRKAMEEDEKMKEINITNFNENVFSILEQVVRSNEPISISTKIGKAVILSEEMYNGLMETIYLSSVPGMKDALAEGMNTPLNECLTEEEVEW